MPMPQLMPGAESPAVWRGIWTHVDDGAVLVSDDLRFAAREAPVLHLDADAMRDRLQFDVGRVRNAQFREKLFGGTHLRVLTPSDCLRCRSGPDARMLLGSCRDLLRPRSCWLRAAIVISFVLSAWSLIAAMICFFFATSKERILLKSAAFFWRTCRRASSNRARLGAAHRGVQSLSNSPRRRSSGLGRCWRDSRRAPCPSAKPISSQISSSSCRLRSKLRSSLI